MANPPHVTSRPYNVLFLCTRNAARGILAEALLNHGREGGFVAFSAGTHPAGEVNPGVLALLNRLKIPAEGLRSKSWDEFVAPGAPHMDFIITLCDKAAGEVTPEWPGHPVTACWSVPDPAMAAGQDNDQNHALRNVLSMLERRISLFKCLPLASLEKLALDTEMQSIGQA